MLGLVSFEARARAVELLARYESPSIPYDVATLSVLDAEVEKW